MSKIYFDFLEVQNTLANIWSTKIPLNYFALAITFFPFQSNVLAFKHFIRICTLISRNSRLAPRIQSPPLGLFALLYEISRVPYHNFSKFVLEIFLYMTSRLIVFNEAFSFPSFVGPQKLVSCRTLDSTISSLPGLTSLFPAQEIQYREKPSGWFTLIS